MIGPITIVIVNWNADVLLKDCLQSIADYHSGLVDRVVVVDNGSTDGSLDALDEIEGLPFPLEVLKNERNFGFGAACNQGARHARSEYLLFLNPDTRLMAGSLSRPLEEMCSMLNKDVGICGIQLLDESGNVARSCARFPTLNMFVANTFAINRVKWYRYLNMHMVEWAHDCTSNVDHVIGAFFFIRRTLFRSMGGFDERFFVYFEDLDMSLRASKLGFRSVYIADAQALHVGGGTSRNVKAHRLFYSLRSRVLFGFKHFRPFNAWVLFLLIAFAEPFTRSLLAVFRRSGSDLRHTWRAYRMLYCNIPHILRSSRRS